jgi:hypothetical protein
MSITRSVKKDKELDSPCDLRVVGVDRISEHPTYEDVS